MNQIHAKDWADDHWGCYTGMDGNPYDDEQGREDDEDRNRETGGEAVADNMPIL